MKVLKQKGKKTPTAIFSYECMMSSLHNNNIMMLLGDIKTSFKKKKKKFVLRKACLATPNTLKF